MPVLAVCRGSQVLNVARGGDLVQHLPEVVGDEKHKHTPGVFADHEVDVKDGSRLGTLLGERAPVKSHHHQGFGTVGEGLVESRVGRGRHARGARGSVEAVRRRRALAPRGGRGRGALPGARRGGPRLPRRRGRPSWPARSSVDGVVERAVRRGADRRAAPASVDGGTRSATRRAAGAESRLGRTARRVPERAALGRVAARTAPRRRRSRLASSAELRVTCARRGRRAAGRARSGAEPCARRLPEIALARAGAASSRLLGHRGGTSRARPSPIDVADHGRRRRDAAEAIVREAVARRGSASAARSGARRHRADGRAGHRADRDSRASRPHAPSPGSAPRALSTAFECDSLPPSDLDARTHRRDARVTLRVRWSNQRQC